MIAPGDAGREWVLACGSRYWPKGAEAIAALPLPTRGNEPKDAAALAYVPLPDWAADVGVGGKLLVPAERIAPESANLPEWQRCDWVSAAGDFLSGAAERAHENAHGPILSYSFRLPKSLAPLYDHAWVNRIFLFLRRWAAHKRDIAEEGLFGPLPHGKIVLTHDVDAISLTPEIRAKQSVFQLVNGARALAGARFGDVAARLGDATRFAFSAGNFRTLERVRAMEDEAGLKSVLHFYAGPPGFRRGSPRRILLDPGYDIASPYLRDELRAFAEGGWTVGLHQSFDAWASAGPMKGERRRVEEAAGVAVDHCRQHWLHFSWGSTWAAQEEAGLRRDSTLGFNDRPGFRAGHALRFHPWDAGAAAPLRLEATPMIFMDSHFYDYVRVEPDEIAAQMKRWTNEVLAVGGEATINWHTHTITDVYGWGRGYEELLGLLS